MVEKFANENIISCNQCSWKTVKPGERNLIGFFSHIPSIDSKTLKKLFNESLQIINENTIEYVPDKGIFPSEIDYCWCYTCKSIEPVFTASHYNFTPKDFVSELKVIGSDHYSKADQRDIHREIGEYSFDELRLKQTDVLKEIQELEAEKASSIFFSFKNWGNRKGRLNSLRFFLNSCIEVLNKCEKKNAEGKEYYENNKTKPRCLKCNSNEVSDKNYLIDSHYKCGGLLKEKTREIPYISKEKKPFTKIQIVYDNTGKLISGITLGGRFFMEESERISFNDKFLKGKINNIFDLYWEYNEEIINNYRNLQDVSDLNQIEKEVSSSDELSNNDDTLHGGKEMSEKEEKLMQDKAFNELYEYTLENDDLRKLKDDIGEDAFKEFLKEEGFKTIKNDSEFDKTFEDVYDQFILDFEKGSKNKRLFDFASDLIERGKKGQKISEKDLDYLFDNEIKDINSYPEQLKDIVFDGNTENPKQDKINLAQMSYLGFIKIDIAHLAEFLNHYNNDRHDGFADIEQYHAIFTGMHDRLIKKLNDKNII